MNNRGEFIAFMTDAEHRGQRALVLGRWSDPETLRQLRPWYNGFTQDVTENLEPVGITDSGFVAGTYIRVVSWEPTFETYNAVGWLDASRFAPDLSSNTVGASSSYLNALSRGGQAAGEAWRSTPNAGCNGVWNDAEAWPIVGRFDSPASGPVLVAKSMTCRGCGTFQRALRNELVGVNDLGEAVGWAEVPDPGAVCWLGFSGWPWQWYVADQGIGTRQVYVGPGGIGATDLTHLLAPFIASPTARGISNQGDIVGFGWANGGMTAFRFNIRTHQFSTPPLATQSYPTQINSRGYALLNVCSTTQGSCTYSQTAVWTPDGNITYLGGYDLPNAALNDKNQLVATWCAPSYYACFLATWDLGSSEDLTVRVARADSPSAPGTAFSIRPSVLSVKHPRPPEALDLVLWCEDSNGRVVPNCDVQLDWSVEQWSGGHAHDTQRPPGVFLTGSGQSAGSTGPSAPGSVGDSTGSTGTLSVTYVAPEASGTTRIDVAASALINGFRASTSSPLRVTVDVAIPGLIRAEAPGIDVAWDSQQHSLNNGYATASMAHALVQVGSEIGQLASDYQIPSFVPRVNALSLPFGGLFDFESEWTPPHRSHRFGNDADFRTRSLSEDQLFLLEKAILRAGLRMIVPSERPEDPGSTHWHASL